MKNITFGAAEKLVRRVGSRNPFDAFDYLNTKVYWSNNHPADGLKGFCIVTLKQRFVMLNANMEESDVKVVSSHELGHIVLHTDGSGAFRFVEFDMCHGADRQENEASFFGADFLVSDSDVMDVIDGRDDRNFYDIAGELGIPVPFMSYKILSMIQRGYGLYLPEWIDSRFLRKPLR